MNFAVTIDYVVEGASPARFLFVAGSVGEEKAYAERIDAIRGIHKQSEEIRSQLADVRTILKDASGEKKQKAEALEKEILVAAGGLKPHFLKVGAAGRLLS